MPTPDPIAMEDLLESFSRIQLSAPPKDTSHATSPAIEDISDSLANIRLHTSANIPPTVLPLSNSSGAGPSIPDKRDANVASKRALQALTHVEEQILLLEGLLVAPSEAQLGSAEAELAGLRSIYSRVTRNTTLVLARKEEIGRHLHRIGSRICELRHLMPEPNSTDNARKPIPYECGLFFKSSGAPISPPQQNILSQIPTNLKQALERFNLSARTTTYAACPTCHFVYPPSNAPDSDNFVYPALCHNRLGSGGGICNTPLLDPRPGSDDQKPVRPYVVHDLKEYESGLLSSAENVRLINASCDETMAEIRRNEPPPSFATGPFQARFVRTFVFDHQANRLFIDRGEEIRLLFALHVDSFNVEGMSVRGASTSCTIISLACLNLPTNIRYKSENIGLIAIIPGPREPHLTELNFYLAPVIDTFCESWERGTCHSRVALHPDGCVSRSAVAAAVMDLVAARKAAQLASHSAHIYCHVCTCSGKATRGRTDFEHWVSRHPQEMRKQAEAWRDATRSSEQDKIFAQHGVRWSELWRLPYWDPTRQLIVDSMHCIFEGLIPYHFRDILRLTSANAKETEVLLPAFEYNFAAVNIEANSQLPEKVRLSDKEVGQVESISHALCRHVGYGPEEQEQGLEDLHRRLLSKNLKALSFVGRGLELPSKTKMTKQLWVDALVTWASILSLHSHSNKVTSYP
ncbi:hypothetical protein GSI_09576 [Ganoderma sinense ZZ0214-1]|uniref:Uncharacterized protein n=1 Tax=Ganoderma sinense ZZ0214-1 TaxID=1077348 RepID=A0A2G8S3Z9_9APHY|nr:hypothetical protein GSI_09576 [Ganoderma sinense ZZ0214-1]